MHSLASFRSKAIQSSSPPPANDPYWAEQAEIVKQISSQSTPEQRKASKFWAGEIWPKSGDSIAIANEYLFSHNIPFAKVLFVRSILAEAAVDVDISLFYSKYTYLIKRPSKVDSSIIHGVVLPKHPSYPSGHSTWFTTWAVLLSNFFPEMKDTWFKYAQEAGQSRIWAGLHYPIDHQGDKPLAPS
jgi:membrane-associated phospholipid phosphatase